MTEGIIMKNEKRTENTIGDLMERKPEQLEKMVARIHSIIEKPDSIITWNDKIVDPDNDRTRQIDITIKRDNMLTIIECRMHKAPQDVKWIEELIGRRMSLNANAVIGVSSSGFTKGAIAKAIKYGIFLKDLVSLTDDEIEKWGRASKLQLNYLYFEKLNIVFYCDSIGKIRIKDQDLFKIVHETMHTATMDIFDKLTEGNGNIAVGFNTENLYFDDVKINYVKIESVFHKINRTLNTSGVISYGPNSQDTMFRDALVELYPGGHNISQSKDSTLIAIDFSRIEHPENTIYHSTEITTQFPSDSKIHFVELGKLNIGLFLRFNAAFEYGWPG